MKTPIDACLSAIEYLQENRDQLPEELSDWLLPGLLRVRSGYAKTIDDSLGLSVGPGEARQRLCYVWRTRERNRLIREAADNLTADYGKVLTAKLIAFAMNTSIPDLHMLKKWETTVLLCKLRQVCMNHRGDSPLAVGWRRSLEIINGDGC
jgi:hypothetical protein